MVSKNREAALLSLWWSETNEKWTQEWRDGLNGEELALVESWDRRFALTCMPSTAMEVVMKSIASRPAAAHCKVNVTRSGTPRRRLHSNGLT